MRGPLAAGRPANQSGAIAMTIVRPAFLVLLSTAALVLPANAQDAGDTQDAVDFYKILPVEAGPAQLGVGFDSKSGSFKQAQCLKQLGTKPDQVQRGKRFGGISLDGASKFENSLQKTSLDVSFNARATVYKIDSRLTFFNETSQTESSISVTYSANHSAPSPAFLLDPNDAIQFKSIDNAEWEGMCGDMFVSSVDRAASLYVTLKATFKSKSVKEKLEAELGGTYTIFELKTKLAKESEAVKKDVWLSVVAYQMGGLTPELGKIFGNADSPEKSLYRASECLAGDFDGCIKVLNGILKYASEDFPKQFYDDNNAELLDRYSDVFYHVLSYQDAGINKGPRRRVRGDIRKLDRALDSLYGRLRDLSEWPSSPWRDSATAEINSLIAKVGSALDSCYGSDEQACTNAAKEALEKSSKDEIAKLLPRPSLRGLLFSSVEGDIRDQVAVSRVQQNNSPRPAPPRFLNLVPRTFDWLSRGDEGEIFVSADHGVSRLTLVGEGLEERILTTVKNKDNGNEKYLVVDARDLSKVGDEFRMSVASTSRQSPLDKYRWAMILDGNIRDWRGWIYLKATRGSFDETYFPLMYMKWTAEPLGNESNVKVSAQPLWLLSDTFTGGFHAAALGQPPLNGTGLQTHSANCTLRRPLSRASQVLHICHSRGCDKAYFESARDGNPVMDWARYTGQSKARAKTWPFPEPMRTALSERRYVDGSIEVGVVGVDVEELGRSTQNPMLKLTEQKQYLEYVELPVAAQKYQKEHGFRWAGTHERISSNFDYTRDAYQQAKIYFNYTLDDWSQERCEVTPDPW